MTYRHPFIDGCCFYRQILASASLYFVQIKSALRRAISSNIRIAIDPYTILAYDRIMTELVDLKGVGPKTLEKLHALGIDDVRSLLSFYPKYYFDMTREADLMSARDGDYVLLRGKFTAIGAVLRARRGLTFFRCTFSTASGKIRVAWFQAPFVRPLLDKEREFLVWGKLTRKENGRELINPSFEPADQNKRLQGIVPIYPLRNKVAQNTFRNIMQQAVEQCRIEGLLDTLGKTPYMQCLKQIHFPTDELQLHIALQTVSMQKLCYQLLAYRLNKNGKDSNKPRTYDAPADEWKPCADRLPFHLTQGQITAIEQIISDLRSSKRTNRMLLGDVGSGKTIVALLSMLYTVQSGYQCAMLCPTEILADQHYRTALQVLAGENVRIARLTGSTPAAEAKQILRGLADGEIDIIIGTHAVFSARVTFASLGLVVIDELHRFGVRQKNALEDKADRADVLIMSATPIPRTIALSLYGDITMSVLQPRSGTESQITTSVIGSEELDAMYHHILQRVQAGEQAYIVCPLVEDCEGLEIVSARSLYRDLQKGVFRDIRVGLIYGTMRESAKQEVMQQFYRGDLDVLIATSVIEVGIDSPRASIMSILNADRFGLAALHQLRGRVGRAPNLPSYCYLHTAVGCENQRLQALVTHADGFAIAELDAELRGYGDFLGVRQSGSASATPLLDKQTVLEAKACVDTLLESCAYDPIAPELLQAIREVQGVSLT